MAKYNITERKEKEAIYRSMISPQLMDEMKEKILNIIVMQKRYKDKNYSAKKLAEDLKTNTRLAHRAARLLGNHHRQQSAPRLEQRRDGRPLV